jgi:hypothetical protein
MSALPTLAAAAVPVARARAAPRHLKPAARHAPSSSHAAAGGRCGSSAGCSCSRHVAPRGLGAGTAPRTRCALTVTAAAPEPETEEGSALDFPEVKTHLFRDRTMGRGITLHPEFTRHTDPSTTYTMRVAVPA